MSLIDTKFLKICTKISNFVKTFQIFVQSSTNFVQSCFKQIEDKLGQSLWCQNHLFLLLNKLNRTALKLRLSSIYFLRLSSIFDFFKSRS